jgi:hypothetical protein
MVEDFVPTIRLAESVRKEKYPECDIISIGTYLQEVNYTDYKMVKYVARIGIRIFDVNKI